MNPFHSSKKQVSIFITAGFPHCDSLTTLLPNLQQRGIAFIEVGIPFSDPMADGPVIQETSTVALQNGMTLGLLFDQLEAIRPAMHIPLVLMGYLNPVLQYGMDRFLERCSALRIASVILPDMSLEIYDRFYRASFERFGIHPTFIVTPTTPDDRVRQIAQTCAGSFVYLVGQSSITGKGYAISETQQQRFAELKQLCGGTPLFMGFGIDSHEKKQQAFRYCDGAIIGTAYLKALAAQTEEVFLTNLLKEETFV